MATGVQSLGTRQLDVLSTCNVEVTSFGNTSSNIIIRMYNANQQNSNHYVYGVSNQAITFVHGNNPALTRVGFGAINTTCNVHLLIGGTTTSSNVFIGTSSNVLQPSLLYIDNGGLLQTYSAASNTVTTTFVADSGRVGINTSVPLATLHVEGSASIAGTLVVDTINIQKPSSPSITTCTLLNTVVVTNDVVQSKRVLFTFTVKQGYFQLTTNLTFTNLTRIAALDTINWATLGLYRTNINAFNGTQTPEYVCPLVSLGTDQESVPFTTFISVDSPNGADYVVAVSGMGHQLAFQGSLYVITVRGLGTNEDASLREKIQYALVRRNFVATANQQTFNVTEPGLLAAVTSNVDVFINGVKNSNVSLTQTVDYSLSNTTFAIGLSSAQPVNTAVEISLWTKPSAPGFYSSSYMQQYITNFAHSTLNVPNGGGIGIPRRLVVDGDIYVKGITTQMGGSQGLSNYPVKFTMTSNIIGTSNIIDLSVTTAKFQDNSILTNDLSDLTVITDDIANGAISTNQVANAQIDVAKLNLGDGGVGVGTSNVRASWHVGGTILTNTGFALSNTTSNISSWTYQQTRAGQYFEGMALASNATLSLETRSLTLADGSDVTDWGPLTAYGSGTCKYYSNGGYLNGSYIQCAFKRLFNDNLFTVNMSVIKGFTVSVLLRFDVNSTGIYTGDFAFFVGVNNHTSSTFPYIRVYRDNARNGTVLVFTMRTASNSFFTTDIMDVTEGEWMLLTLVLDKNSVLSIYKNGKLITTGTGAYTNNITTVGIMLAGASGNNSNCGYISYGAFYFYNRILSAEEIASLTAYVLQGYATNPLSKTQVIQHTPTPLLVSDNVSGSTIDINSQSSVRCHSIPSDHLAVFDVTTPQSTFLIDSTKAFPVFNTQTWRIEMTTSQFMTSTLSQFIHIKSIGLTILLRFKLSQVSSNEQVLNLTTPSAEFIKFRRVGSTNQFLFFVNIATGLLLFTNTNLQLEQEYTIALTIHAGNTASIWVNGVLDATDSTTLMGITNFGDKFFQSVEFGSFNGTLTLVAIYDRALSASEILYCHNVLMSSTIGSLTVGNRLSTNTFNITGDGVVPSLNMATTQYIPDMLVHVTCDGHLYDTLGANISVIPNGDIQFTSLGRMKQSAIFINNPGSNAINFVTYNMYNPNQSTGVTFCAWVKRYDASSVMCPFDICDSQNTFIASVRITQSSISCMVRSYDGTIVTLDTGTLRSATNEWVHIAISIIDLSINVYVNGVVRATNNVVNTPSLVVNSFYIGCTLNTTLAFSGEIDDFRIYSRVLTVNEVQNIVNMTSDNHTTMWSEDRAVEAFTLHNNNIKVQNPIVFANNTALTSAVSSSSNYGFSDVNVVHNLVTSSYSLKDMTNNHSNIALYGSMAINQLSPFDNIDDEGSLRIVDVQPSFITLPITASTNFSAECWVRYTSASNASFTLGSTQVPCLMGRYDVVTNTPAWNFGMNNSSKLAFTWYDVLSNVNVIQGATNISLDTWNHVAFTVSNNNVTLFLNGINQATTSAFSNVATSPTSLTIGSYSNTSVNAYISNLGYTQAAVYTANFTPNKVPTSVRSNMSMLLRVFKQPTNILSLSKQGILSTMDVTSQFNMSMYKNRIINGDMKFNQRSSGTAYTFVNPGIGETTTLDRWNIAYSVSSGSFQVLQNTLVANDAPFRVGIINSLRINITNALTSYSYILPTQRLEGNMISDLGWMGYGSGAFASLSFWFKANNLGRYQVALEAKSTNLPQSFVRSFDYNTANTWTYVTTQIPPPPGNNMAAWQGSNNEVLTLRLGHLSKQLADIGIFNGWTLPGSRFINVSGYVDWASTTNNFIEFTGVQLEKGSISTSFEFRPYPIELSLCQRYYETSGNLVSVYPESDYAPSDTVNVNVGAIISFATQKRTQSYNVSLSNALGSNGFISTKFANVSLSNNVVPIVLNKLDSSFYLAISGGASGFSSISGVPYGNFVRGNMIFKWNIDDEMR